MTGAGLAALATYANHVGAVTIAMVFCLVFVSLIWSMIGIFVLADRAKGNQQKRDCSWGYRPEGISLHRTTPEDATACWFLEMPFRNTKDWPIQAEELESEWSMNGKIADIKAEISIPVVVMPSTLNSFFFKSFGPNVIKSGVSYRARVTVKMKYGNTGEPASRILIRKYGFEVTPSTLIPIFPLAYHSVEVDQDIAVPTLKVG